MSMRTDGKIVPGSPAGKIGPPLPPHPWTTNWWIENALAFTPVGAAQGLAEAVDTLNRLPRNPTWGELLPAVGKGALAVVGAVPVFGPEVRAGMRVARATDDTLRAGVDAAKAVQSRSRNVSVLDPPPQPQRPFAADYPQGARADAAGRLTHDIEGRELVADRVVGRKVVGGNEQAVAPAELNALAEAVTGTPPKIVASREIRGDAGRYHEGWDPVTGDRIRGILLNRALSASQLPRVLGHEVGHAIEEMAGRIPTDGIVKELRSVYNVLNNPAHRGQTQTRRLMGPEQFRYEGAEVHRELIAEAIRACVTDPNYLKTVAPGAAARIRKYVNSHPHLSRQVQFNSLTAPAIPIGMLLPAVVDEEPRP